MLRSRHHCYTILDIQYAHHSISATIKINNVLQLTLIIYSGDVKVAAIFHTANVMHCRRCAVQSKGIKLKEEIRSTQEKVDLRNNTITFQ